MITIFFDANEQCLVPGINLANLIQKELDQDYQQFERTVSNYNYSDKEMNDLLKENLMMQKIAHIAFFIFDNMLKKNEVNMPI